MELSRNKAIPPLSICVLLYMLLMLSCNERSILKSDSKVLKQKKINGIDSLFQDAVNRHQIPGAVALIRYEGNIIFEKAYGYKNIKNKKIQQVNNLFRWASMTKGLTAAAILQLHEKKLLHLDDDISKYLSDFKNQQILQEVNSDSTFTSYPAEGKISIRQLLTHSAGIGYGFQDDRYNALVVHNNVSEGFCPDDRTSMQNTKKIAALPLLQEPGEGFIYSLSYDVLGTLIEVLSGLRYDIYIKKHLLVPLEMKDTYFIIPAKERDKLVAVYQPAENKSEIIPTTYKDIDYPVIETRRFFSGGADLCGTANDYSNFLQMLLNGGTYNQKRILNEKSVMMMLSKQTLFEDGDSDQGFAAWVTNEKGAKNSNMSKGSYGFGGFFDTYSWADPELKFNAVLMLQMYPNNIADIHGKYQKLVYELMHKLNKKEQ